MKGFQIQPSIPEFEMSPSTSMPNLLDDIDSPGSFASLAAKSPSQARSRISKFKFNMQRTPTRASRQWDLVFRAATKKKKETGEDLNHSEATSPKQTIIDMRGTY